jgi:alpha-1,6-mannosyltransferase
MSKRDRSIAWCTSVALLLSVVVLGYGPHRRESALLLGAFAFAFLAYLLCCAYASGLGMRGVLTLGLVVRVLLLFAPITWTDDHYRYWWDGLCTVNDISPFAHTPRELLALRTDVFSKEHLALLNSPDFHSAYPPLAQAAFACPSWIGHTDGKLWSLFMRMIVVVCETLSIGLLVKLMRGERSGPRAVAVYAFNPLVLMEHTVNLHTEALMVPCCIGAVLMLRHDRTWAAGLLIGAAASIRLMPLVFLLALPAVVGVKRSILPSVVGIAVFIASWLPFCSPDLVPNFLSSLKLFSTYLEFNGGFYELLRLVLGNGVVKGTGLLGALTVAALMVYAVIGWRKGMWKLEEGMLWLLAIVLFGSQAVHPWYITPLIALATLTRWRWPLWWSLLIAPTYLTYAQAPYTQPYWWIGIEYMVLVVLIAFEWRKKVSLAPVHTAMG